MSIGHQIIDFIVEHGLVRSDTEEPTVLIWTGNAAEQLEALIASHESAPRKRKPADPYTGC